MGNSVIIELKRKNSPHSPLGVETQALQYLADFSKFKGDAFIKQFSGDSPGLSSRSSIWSNLRVMGSDPTLFSMGEWLSGRGIAFSLDLSVLDLCSYGKLYQV